MISTHLSSLREVSKTDRRIPSRRIRLEDSSLKLRMTVGQWICLFSAYTVALFVILEGR